VAAAGIKKITVGVKPVLVGLAEGFFYSWGINAHKYLKKTFAVYTVIIYRVSYGLIITVGFGLGVVLKIIVNEF